MLWHKCTHTHAYSLSITCIACTLRGMHFMGWFECIPPLPQAKHSLFLFWPSVHLAFWLGGKCSIKGLLGWPILAPINTEEVTRSTCSPESFLYSAYPHPLLGCEALLDRVLVCKHLMVIVHCLLKELSTIWMFISQHKHAHIGTSVMSLCVCVGEADTSVRLLSKHIGKAVEETWYRRSYCLWNPHRQLQQGTLVIQYLLKTAWPCRACVQVGM